MRAGLDIARLWLPGEAAILTVEGRDQGGTAAIMQVSVISLPLVKILPAQVKFDSNSLR